MALISTEGLERLLASFSERINQQQAQIEALQTQLASLLPSADHLATLQRLVSQVNALEQRVSLLERDTAVPAAAPAGSGAEGSVTSTFAVGSIGAVVGILSVRCQQLESSLSQDVATKEQLQAAFHMAEVASQRAVASLAERSSSKETVELLQAGQEALLQTLSSTQAALANKVERADILRLEALAADLQSFHNFKTAASEDIRALYSRSELSSSGLREVLDTLRSLSEASQTTLLELESKCSKESMLLLSASVSDLQALLMNLPTTEQQVETLMLDMQASKESQQTLAASLAALECKSQKEWQQAEQRREEADRAGRRDWRAGLEQLSAALAAVQVELDARAYTSTVGTLEDTVASVTGSVAALSKRVDVCLRFIEWYSDRGSAYEHNASALEQHMNALAVGNRAPAASAATAASHRRT